MRASFRTSLMLALGWGCAPLAFLVLAGCQPQAKRIEPVRAIWVTRFDYKTPDDVARIVDNCANAGFNTILFQVRGNGTAFYNSAYEPWADELGGSHPGFDPLAQALQRARQRDVELHAWVNVIPGWRGAAPPADPRQLYHRHPEWFWYDQYGNRQPLSSFYVSLNPCLPEVRQYLVEVFRDLVRKYDVDGLHMDYIRFPNEPPGTPSGTDIDYPYDQRTLALYQQQTGLTPKDDPAAWSRWRTQQVTRLVADIHAMLRRTRPDAVLTSSVGSVPQRALKHFQDGRRWMADGIVDAVFLMNYTESPEEFRQRLEPWLVPQPPVPIVPGLWFGRVNEQRTVQQGIEDVRRQIEIAQDLTGNFCVFAYSSLFDSADQAELAKQGEEQRRMRQARRANLIPFLRSMAASN